MNKLRCLLVLLTFSLGQSVFAATFNFAGLGSVPASGYSETVDGVTVNISTPGGNNLDFYTFNSNGYGIGHSGCVSALFIPICSAAIQQNESLLVSFSESVTVTGITLAAWDGPDEAFIEAGPGGNTLTIDEDPDLFGQVSTFDLSSLGELTSFTITNTKYAGLFTLRGLEVATTEVPIPSAAFLFGSALMAIGGIARRNRR